MKTIAVIQVRMGSIRLPKKVLKHIGGIPALELLVRRLRRSQLLDQIVLAIADEPEAYELVAFAERLGLEHVIGSKENVLSRYGEACRRFSADVVVRITGDCPFIDPHLVDQVIALRAKTDAGYASNIQPPTFPDGLDVEVFTRETLEQSEKFGLDAINIEHVTPYMRNSQNLKRSNLANSGDYSSVRLTLDELVDLQVLNAVYEGLGDRDDFSLEDLLDLWELSPGLFERNNSLSRNLGGRLGSGQKLWKHAKEVIPGGNMLLSKRGEMFLPEHWPSYFSKAKGCEVWDLDGNHFFDLASMGVGTNTLGYGNPAVDDAVLRVVRDGNMSTLNCPEEVMLADKLLELNQWAGMVRLARTGGEANAIAVRIARSFTGKDKIAICGYHGWHDWYLSANLADDANLDGHLLPGLQPSGVPRQLKGTVTPFEYNDLERLKQILSGNEIAAIKMEVFRSIEPEDDFLQEVRRLATEHGVVLIFDECTSGFRETYGGLHTKYNVEPDIAVFGKAMGNGYAITAVVGKSEIMQSAQSSFISSTFWTERIGPTAALASLSEMKRVESWKTITEIGIKVRNGWLDISKHYGVPIKVSGLPALSSFTFASSMHLQLKTYVTQEMLKRGFLASNLFYASTAHSDSIVEQYLDSLGQVFQDISRLLSDSPTAPFLNGPVSHSGFSRIN